MYPRDSGDLGDDDSPRKVKRARVSVACLECRKKKERCDGTHPVCTPCHKQNRHCYYSPPEKRRGLPTGYVRSLETLFGMLLHSVCGTEQSTLAALKEQLKVQSTGSNTANAPNGNFFIETWRHSEPYKDLEVILVSTEGKESDSVAAKSLHNKLEAVITRILSISTDHRSNSPSELGLSQENTSARANLSFHTNTSAALNGEDRLTPQEPISSQLQRHLARRQLPSDWHTLTNRYYNNVHCWFPIIPKQDILRRAHAVSTAGTNGATITTGELASLWAVFAYALYYETSMSSASDSNSDTGQHQERYWKDMLQDVIELSMNPTAVAEAGHIQALLLSALLCIGGGSFSQAWFLVGRAVYMMVDLGLTKDHNNTVTLPTSDKLERLSLGCFMLDTLISCQLKRRPYLKTTDLHHLGLSNVDGIEEWESWPLESSNSPSIPPSPAKVLSCFSTFVQQVSLLNDFSHLSQDTIDQQSGNSMVQDIIRLGSPHFPSQLSPDPTPQSLNIFFATASFSNFLWRNIASLSGNKSLAGPWSLLPELPERINQHLQSDHHRYDSPLYDIYLQFCTNGSRMKSLQHDYKMKAKSTFKGMLELIHRECNSTIRTSDQANEGENLELASTSNTAATMEPIRKAGTDLYHSLISLDDVNWPDASRVFMENLGMIQGDLSLDDENIFNF